MKTFKKPFIILLIIITLLYSLMGIDGCLILMTKKDTTDVIIGFLVMISLGYLDIIIIKFLVNKFKNN